MPALAQRRNLSARRAELLRLLAEHFLERVSPVGRRVDRKVYVAVTAWAALGLRVSVAAPEEVASTTVRTRRTRPGGRIARVQYVNASEPLTRLAALTRTRTDLPRAAYPEPAPLTPPRPSFAARTRPAVRGATGYLTRGCMSTPSHTRAGAPPGGRRDHRPLSGKVPGRAALQARQAAAAARPCAPQHGAARARRVALLWRGVLAEGVIGPLR